MAFSYINRRYLAAHGYRVAGTGWCPEPDIKPVADGRDSTAAQTWGKIAVGGLAVVGIGTIASALGRSQEENAG